MKNRIEQALLLRGSCEFSSIAEYQAVINQAVERLNAQHAEKIETEIAYLQPLPQGRVADYEVLTAKVSCHSTIDVRCVLYTVPARLIGAQLELHLYHDRIVGYWHRQQVVELPRIRTSGKGKRRARCINYRHVAEGLRRKPRAFLYCTWQQDLLPNEQWQHLWQQMKTQFELDTAAVLIVESLYIAATSDNQAAVAQYLQTQLETNTLTLAGLQQQFGLLKPTPVPTLHPPQLDLTSYDQLLSPGASAQPLPKPESTPQAIAPLPYAHSLGNPRSSGDAGELVVRAVLAGALRIGDRASLECSPAKSLKPSSTAKRKNFFQL